MMLHLQGVLSKQQVAQCREVLDAAQWIDGNATSGEQSAQAKRNQQLPEGSTAARAVGDAIQDALGRNPRFFSAALPLKVFPPLFNRYAGGDGFGTHVTMRSGTYAAPTSAFAAICRPRSFLPSRILTTAANSASKTPMVCIARSCRRAIWCSTPLRACIT